MSFHDARSVNQSAIESEVGNCGGICGAGSGVGSAMMSAARNDGISAGSSLCVHRYGFPVTGWSDGGRIE